MTRSTSASSCGLQPSTRCCQVLQQSCATPMAASLSPAPAGVCVAAAASSTSRTAAQRQGFCWLPWRCRLVAASRLQVAAVHGDNQVLRVTCRTSHVARHTSHITVHPSQEIHACTSDLWVTLSTLWLQQALPLSPPCPLLPPQLSINTSPPPIVPPFAQERLSHTEANPAVSPVTSSAAHCSHVTCTLQLERRVSSCRGC